jgi:hypothetical protein
MGRQRLMLHAGHSFEDAARSVSGGEPQEVGVPVSYVVKPDLNIVLVRFEGDVDVDENINVFLDYLADPQFNGRHNILMDLVDCGFPDRYFADTRRLAFKLEPYYAARHPESRTSIYAPADVAFGTSRMYAFVAEEKASHAIEVFRTTEEALRFAELDPSDDRVRGLLRPGDHTS